MYMTYRIRTDELNDDFLASLKTLFRDKTIEIAVCEADDKSEDETAYLLRDPANRRRLMEAIKNVHEGQTVENPVGSPLGTDNHSSVLMLLRSSLFQNAPTGDPARLEETIQANREISRPNGAN